jgi:hypothetical protein
VEPRFEGLINLPRTLQPVAMAYWHASPPRPPPAPGIATHSPTPRRASLRPRSTVTPAPGMTTLCTQSGIVKADATLTQHWCGLRHVETRGNRRYIASVTDAVALERARHSRPGSPAVHSQSAAVSFGSTRPTSTHSVPLKHVDSYPFKHISQDKQASWMYLTPTRSPTLSVVVVPLPMATMWPAPS